MLNVLRQSKGYPLRHSQASALLEADIIINVDYLSCGKLHQEVVKVTVSKANDVTNHAHDSSGARVGLCD